MSQSFWTHLRIQTFRGENLISTLVSATTWIPELDTLSNAVTLPMNHLSPCLQRLSTLLLLTRPVVLTVMYWGGILYFPQDGGSCPTWPPLRFMPMCSDKQTIILCVTPITHWLTVYINWMWLEASCLLFFNYLFLTPHFLLETVHRHSVELSSSTNLLELNDLFSDKKRTFMKIFLRVIVIHDC